MNIEGVLEAPGSMVFEKGCCGQVNVTSDVVRILVDSPTWLEGQVLEIFHFGLLDPESPWMASGSRVCFEIKAEDLGVLCPWNPPELGGRKPFLEHVLRGPDCLAESAKGPLAGEE